MKLFKKLIGALTLLPALAFGGTHIQQGDAITTSSVTVTGAGVRLPDGTVLTSTSTLGGGGGGSGDITDVNVSGEALAGGGTTGSVTVVGVSTISLTTKNETITAPKTHTSSVTVNTNFEIRVTSPATNTSRTYTSQTRWEMSASTTIPGDTAHSRMNVVMGTNTPSAFVGDWILSVSTTPNLTGNTPNITMNPVTGAVTITNGTGTNLLSLSASLAGLNSASGTNQLFTDATGAWAVVQTTFSVLQANSTGSTGAALSLRNGNGGSGRIILRGASTGNTDAVYIFANTLPTGVSPMMIDASGNISFNPTYVSSVTFVSSMTLSGGFPVQNVTPTSGQVLKFDGTNWAPGTDNNTGGGGGSSTLAVFNGATVLVSSPTPAVVADSTTITAYVIGVSSTGLRVNTSSITAQGNNFNIAQIARDSGTVNADLQTTKSNVATSTNTLKSAIDNKVVSMSTGGVMGTMQAAQFPALTGDMTTSAGSLVTTAAATQSNIRTLSNSSITVTGASGLGVQFEVRGGSFTMTGDGYPRFTTGETPANVYDYVGSSAATTVGNMCIFTSTHGAVGNGGVPGAAGVTYISTTTTGGTQLTGGVSLIPGSNVTMSVTGGTITIASTGGAGTPGGSNRSLQYNSTGTFAGAGYFSVYDTSYTVAASTVTARYVYFDYSASSANVAQVKTAQIVVGSPTYTGAFAAYVKGSAQITDPLTVGEAGSLSAPYINFVNNNPLGSSGQIMHGGSINSSFIYRAVTGHFFDTPSNAPAPIFASRIVAGPDWSSFDTQYQAPLDSGESAFEYAVLIGTVANVPNAKTVIQSSAAYAYDLVVGTAPAGSRQYHLSVSSMGVVAIPKLGSQTCLGTNSAGEIGSGTCSGGPGGGIVSLSTGVMNVLPIASGGTGTSSTLVGLVRGNASAMTAAELSGDATTSGSNAVTLAATQSNINTLNRSSITVAGNLRVANNVVASSFTAGAPTFAGISADALSRTRIATNGILALESKDTDANNSAGLYVHTASTNPSINSFIDLARASGTIAAPFDTQANQNLGRISGSGYGGGIWLTTSTARIDIYAGQGFTSGTAASGIKFMATSSGSTVSTERINITPDNGILVTSTMTVPGMTVSGGSFTVAGISNLILDASLTLKPITTPTSDKVQNGQIWQDSTNKALQAVVDNTSMTIVGTFYTVSRSSTDINNTGKTNLLPPANTNQTLTLPPNFWTVGKTVNIVLLGSTTVTGTPNLTVNVQMGSTVMASTGPIAAVATSSQTWRANISLTCISTGASGRIQTFGEFTMINTKTTATYLALMDQGNTIDTTASQTFSVNTTWGTANPATYITLTNGYIQMVN